MALTGGPSFPTKFVVICCPVSGKKDGLATLKRDFFPRAKELGLDVELALTERPGHANELAAECAKKGAGIVVVGGDGTLHEVMDGLLACNKLNSTVLGILSQGTMNCFYHSSQLPDASQLAGYLANKSMRRQSLMKVHDDTGDIDSMCFEAVYIGVGYRPAKGAQEWRKSRLGPFFGIMYNLVKANLMPKTVSVSGTLTMYPRDGGPVRRITDTFFWIVITQRNPYNGTTEPDAMWVSYLRLDAFPGFGRMMDAFSPPFEFMSGLATMMEDHVDCSKVVWEQSEGNIGVCLDGDPMDAGKTLTAEHAPNAWHIVAEKAFPERLPDSLIKPRPITAEARQWLDRHPPSKSTFFAARNQLEANPTASRGFGVALPLLLLAGVVAATYSLQHGMVPGYAHE